MTAATPMKPVKSSSISAVGYNPSARELHVKFTNGGSYIFEGISPEKHQALISAPSVGTHFQNHIRSGGYKSRKA
jgi:hypothetical protein